MRRLGIRRYEDLVGRVDLLEADAAIEHWKARGVDLTHVLAAPPVTDDAPRRRVRPQDSPLPAALDWTLIEAARDAIDHRMGVTGEFDVRNVNRTVGGLLSSAVTKVHGAAGLPPGTIRFTLRGSRRPVVRRLARARRRADADRRRQRLHRQGPVRRRADRAPARGRDLQGRGERRHRQHRALRRDVAAARSSAGSPASASPCATPAPPPSSRASATTAAST